jgi:hypothetical protein
MSSSLSIAAIYKFLGTREEIIVDLKSSFLQQALLLKLAAIYAKVVD